MSKYHTPKPISTGLKSGSNSCTPLKYDILRDKKLKKKLRQNITSLNFDMNLTVVLKSTPKILFINNFFDKNRKVVTKNQQIKKIIYSFFYSPVKFQKVNLRGFDTTATIWFIVFVFLF